ncbi:MAG: hypothetical protein PHY16_01270 [Methylobacter sp.]|nr:hypothetical protein [Methylobacter sp.]
MEKDKPLKLPNPGEMFALRLKKPTEKVWLLWVNSYNKAPAAPSFTHMLCIQEIGTEGHYFCG